MLQISEMMIQVSVTGLVCADVQDHISESGVLFHMVILDGLIGSPHLLPHLQIAIVDLLEHHRVGVHGLFFKIAHKPVAKRRRQHVGQEVGVEENTLATSDQHSVDNARVPQLQEEKQVHAFILCLLEQMMNPSVVSLQRSQTAQVPLHSTNHSWHSRNRLKKDNAVHPHTLIHLVHFFLIILGDRVETGTGELNQVPTELGTEALWRLVRELHSLSVLLGVDRVRHPITFRVKHNLVLNHLVQETSSVLMSHLQKYPSYKNINYKHKLLNLHEI